MITSENHFSVFAKAEAKAFQVALVVKSLPANARNIRDMGLILGREDPRHGNLLQYSCLENPYGQRSLGGYSPCGHTELDMTERLHFTSIGYQLLLFSH